MNDLLLHPQTRHDLVAIAKGTTHAVLLSGDTGSGKYTVALELARQLLGLASLENAPYFLHIHGDTKAVSIEQIRQVQTFLQLKTAGKSKIRRVVLIEKADTMTDEAQNALLKALEEPPLDTVVILTASEPQRLKQTIQSRVQSIAIKPVSITDATNFYTGYSSAEVSRAYSLSMGNVGLMTALLNEEADHTVAQAILVAKELYSLTTFERLARIDKLIAQKDSLPDLLYSFKRISRAALEQAVLKEQTKVAQSWHLRLTLIQNTEQRLALNTNLKLLLSDLFLQM